MKPKLKIAIMVFCSLMAVGFDYVKYLDFGEIFKGLDSCLKLGYLGTFILLILLFKLFSKKLDNKHWIISVLGYLFAFFMVFGASYMKYGTMRLVFGSLFNFVISLIVFLGYYFIFRRFISWIYIWLDKYKIKDYSNKLIDIFKKYPFLISLVIIILCWVPFIIAYYPTILSPDPSFQIKQYFGIRTKYADYSVLLDENVVLTNHHPVAHTILLGSCLKLGVLIGNDNLGLFFYSIIQIAVLSSVLAYSIKYVIKDMKMPSILALVMLLIYAVVPMYSVYSMSAIKDVLFSSFVLLYIILLHRILNYKKDRLNVSIYIKLIIVMMLMTLFRNNGIHLIVLSFPFLIFVVKKYWKPLLCTLVITLGLSMCYTKVILPAFKITPGSIRETLSIPFQQTARLVKYHEEALSEKDINAIDKILGYETLGDRYNPELSDPVKNEYNKYATSDDLKEYFKVWFKGLFKYPMTYVNATINNTYGFFYPDKTSWYIHTNYDTRIVKDGFDYHFNKLDDYREDVSDYAENFPKIPVVGLLVNIGFSTWIVFMLVGYFIEKKKYDKIILYLPALISILVCIAGPANTYFRYAMPYMFSLPLMVVFALEREKN